MGELATGLETMRKLSVEELLLPVLVQLIVIISVARVAAILFRRIGQPSAVGEIIAGLLLGPSLMGWVAPEWSALIFRPQFEDVPSPITAVVIPKIFMVLAQLGLILLLFLIGLEFDFGHLRHCGPSAVAISLTGIALPMVLGVGFGLLVHGRMEPHPERGEVAYWGFALFMGVAMSITAIPILGRMMIELNIQRTRLGAVTITAAAVDDAAGWILLATVAGIVRSGFDPTGMLRMVAETIGFMLVMVYIVRPLFTRWINASLRKNQGQITVNGLTITLCCLLAAALMTNLIGIFAIFGAFFFGAILSDQEEFRTAITTKLRDFVTAFFLPVFFTYTGLRTQIGTLGSLESGLIALGVIAIATIAKFGGCGLAAYLSGFSKKESMVIGVMMNTRALMELIVINAGYDLGVIPPSMFTMLVLMALVSTVITTPILLRLRHGTELERPIAESGFLQQNGKSASAAG